jgi:S-formylglutathione hydrolase FrmB
VALLVLAVVVAGVAVVLVAALRGVNTRGARVIHFTIDSSLVHQTLTEAAVTPAGGSGAGRSLLVFLHGKGENEDSNLSGQFFAALAQLGSRAPDVVFPDGGEDSYWHDREDGAWGSYVMDEVIPRAVRLLGVDPRRVAIGGLSMGGFGAYDLAHLHPGRFCAVGGDSPALWLSGGESAAGAFDSASDFARNNIIQAAAGSPNPYPGARLWIDVGSEDPFRSADTTFARILRSKGLDVEFHVWPGGHEPAYWNSHWGSYLDWVRLPWRDVMPRVGSRRWRSVGRGCGVALGRGGRASSHRSRRCSSGHAA